MYRIGLLAAALILVGVNIAGAQGAAFKSGVDVVALAVTVTDPQGRSVTGLTADDFAVFEEGVRQTLSLFRNGDVPVDLAFVLDTSSSMSGALPIVKKAARGLVNRLHGADRAAVFDVKGSVRIPQPLTQDRGSIASAVDALSARGDTAVYDGMYMSLREFERERRANPAMRRQALIVLSDGLDTTSHVTFEDVTGLARTLDVTIYTVSLRDARLPVDTQQEERLRRATWEMRTLARETGGLAFFASRAAELEGVYEAIGNELANQYALAYVPGGPRRDGAFRRVAVKVLPPATGIPRTRSGYVATKATRLTAGLYKPPTNTSYRLQP